ncbi:hypothetical protein ACQ4PT_068545 [Festuca glaucescens]
MVHQSKTAAVALFLIAAVVAAASVPAVSAYGCYDDCYERCANGKQDPACVKMCNEACGGIANTLLGGAAAAAGAGASVVGAGASVVGAGASAVGAGASAVAGGAAAPTA